MHKRRKRLLQSRLDLQSLSGVSSFFSTSCGAGPLESTGGFKASYARAILSALPTTENNGANRVYCSLFESRGISPQVGMCFVDPFTSEMKITEIRDSQSYVRTIHKLSIISSSNVTVLIPECYRTSHYMHFTNMIHSNLPQDGQVCFVSTSLFKCSEASMELVCKYVASGTPDMLKLELGKRKYALAATVAALQYLLTSSSYHFEHIKFNVKYEPPEMHMFITMVTIRNLELVESKFNDSVLGKTSLYNYLNSTMTPMGGRLLRSNILQPLTDKKSIIMRQKAVTELLANEGSLRRIVHFLKSISDMDKLVSCLCKKPKKDESIFTDQRINFVLLLKQCLTVGHQVAAQLEVMRSAYLASIYATLRSPQLVKALKIIDATINEDVVWASKPADIRKNKCYAVKSGNNGLLDTHRALYKAKVDLALDTIAKLGQKYSMVTTSKYNARRGFFIVAHDSTVEQILSIPHTPFINAVQKKQHVECTTMELVKLNNRIDCALKEIYVLTESSVEELISKLSEMTEELFMATEAFALLDMLCSFAFCVNSSPGMFTCPEIRESGIHIKESRHPLLNNILRHGESTQSMVANDYISNEESKFNVITGRNMSGKSWYLKQLALLTILVQIGMFVPADFASLQIFHSLFARIGHDVTEPNMSTFSTEMVEMALILQHSNKDTLCIIDELGRGTSYCDGVSISLAMSETLMRSGATCFLVTHFTDIPRLLGEHAAQLIMDVDQDGLCFEYKYKAVKGIEQIPGYGIGMAEKLRIFPQSLTENAKAIALALNNQEENGLSNIDTTSEPPYTEKELLMRKFIEDVRCALSITDDETMVCEIAQLEKSFVNRYALLNESSSKDSTVESEDCSNEENITNTTATPERQSYMTKFGHNSCR